MAYATRSWRWMGWVVIALGILGSILVLVLRRAQADGVLLALPILWGSNMLAAWGDFYFRPISQRKRTFIRALISTGLFFLLLVLLLWVTKGHL